MVTLVGENAHALAGVRGDGSGVGEGTTGVEDQLSTQYRRRFEAAHASRLVVWRVLIDACHRAWRLLGKPFMVIVRKPATTESGGDERR